MSFLQIGALAYLDGNSALAVLFPWKHDLVEPVMGCLNNLNFMVTIFLVTMKIVLWNDLNNM